MPKTITQPINAPSGKNNDHDKAKRNEPLSGSKKVKNRNHSRQNHGEGS